MLSAFCQVRNFCTKEKNPGSRGDFSRTIGYHNLCLKIANELGDTSVEGNAYDNVGMLLEVSVILKRP